MNLVAENKNRNGRTSWYGFDLDGTLAYHVNGEEFDPLKIGVPILKMVHFLKWMLAQGAYCKIFTARVSVATTPQERFAIEKVIKEWCKIHIGQELDVTCVKDYACLGFFDDRAHHVIANTGEIVSSQFSN